MNWALGFGDWPLLQGGSEMDECAGDPERSGHLQKGWAVEKLFSRYSFSSHENFLGFLLSKGQTICFRPQFFSQVRNFTVHTHQQCWCADKYWAVILVFPLTSGATVHLLEPKFSLVICKGHSSSLVSKLPSTASLFHETVIHTMALWVPLAHGTPWRVILTPFTPPLMD